MTTETNFAGASSDGELFEFHEDRRMTNETIAEQALQAMFAELGQTIREIETDVAVDVTEVTTVTATAERTARYAAAYAFMTWARCHFLHTAMVTASAASEPREEAH